MVDRILKMLNQFLISNQTLKLNETFKVYLKVLSLEHMKHKAITKARNHPKRTTKFYKKHYGARIKATKKYNFFWALDVPDSYPNEPIKDVFKNKCFLTATILGLLQNEFYKSKRNDTRFLYIQNINSTSKKKKTHAGNLLYKELTEILQKTKLPLNGPYELESTSKVLSEHYKCQFFIFDGVDNSNKITFMYPDIYDDTLIPIYLYQPLDAPNHVVFIRHLNSYFKSNVKICFACKKIFLTYNYKHLCKKSKCCFSCRRFFLSEKTYVHERLLTNFCNKNLTSESSFNCNLCNVTCYSNHCFLGHKLLCTGKGTFGYKCLKCNKFTYRHGNLNGTDLKNSHVCGENKYCNYCREFKTENHLCKLTKDVMLTWDSKLAFIGMEHFDNSSENCLICYDLKTQNSVNSFCDNHSNLDTDIEPCIVIIYHENVKASNVSNFTKYVVDTFNNEPEILKEENVILSSELLNKKTNSKKRKNVKQTLDFKENLKNLHRRNNFFLLDKVISLITRPEWFNTTFICQDNDSKCYMSLLKAFIRTGFCPVVVRNGRKILVLEIKPLQLRFITSNTYFDGNEYEFAQFNDIIFDKYYFPKLFLQSKNFNYEGDIPHKLFFTSITDNDKEIKKKEEFILNFQTKKYKWNFRKELITFCEQKLFLLALSSLRFINESLNFQTHLKQHLEIKDEKTLHPFAFPLCTMGGFTYTLFKLFYLNNLNIFTVNNEYGVSTKNVSKIEYEWSCYMQFLFPEKEFVSAFNNPNGQKYFKEAIPDLYSPITKQAYFFHGCVFHGHFDNCLINPKATESTKNPFGKSYKELNDSFLIKMQSLLSNNADIDEVVIRWECHYRKLREDLFIQNFLQTKFKFHPLYRLRPRSCVRGAFFDVYALQWSEKLFPDETMYYLDVNGLYSYCAMKFKYMIGKYYIVIGQDVDKIQIVNNKLVYLNTPMIGSILVTILPPKNLRFPFLLYRTKDGKTINTLCTLCSEKKISNCNHSDFDRALTGCYMISEIEFSLTLGYKILYIHECHFYEQSDYILKDFVQILNFLKTKHSNVLLSKKSCKDKQDYCNLLNKEMDLSDPFLLTPLNIKYNKTKRTFFKLMANSLFGKLEQRNDKSQTLYVSKHSDLEEIFFSDNKIIDIFCLNDTMCQVEVKPNVLKLPPNRKTNCYIGAQVTAYARETIYKHLQTLLTQNAEIYQIDCDSIIFTLPKSSAVLLPISDCVGHFKNEIQGRIVSYYSLGPKNYSISFCNQQNQYETLSKVSETFKYYVDQFVKGKKENIKIKQQRNRGNFKKMKINSTIENVTFRNDLFDRRILKTNTLNYATYPYGM